MADMEDLVVVMVLVTTEAMMETFGTITTTTIIKGMTPMEAIIQTLVLKIGTGGIT